MKFDLDKFKAGQKALTRDGRVATFVGVCGECKPDYKLIVYIEGKTQVDTFSLDGRFYHESPSSFDLIEMVKVCMTKNK